MYGDCRDLALLQDYKLLLGAVPGTISHVKNDHTIDWIQHLADLFHRVGNSETIFHTNI
jgi:hypothetical protein